jgi:hypothetical protein
MKVRIILIGFTIILGLSISGVVAAQNMNWADETIDRKIYLTMGGHGSGMGGGNDGGMMGNGSGMMDNTNWMRKLWNSFSGSPMDSNRNEYNQNFEEREKLQQQIREKRRELSSLFNSKNPDRELMDQKINALNRLEFEFDQIR